MKKQNKHKQEIEEKFALPHRNVVLLMATVLVIVLGFALMAGGGSKDPELFAGETLFNFRRMVLAPILVCGGFVFAIVAISAYKKTKRQ